MLVLGMSTLPPPSTLDLGSPNKHAYYDNYAHNNSLKHTNTIILVILYRLFLFLDSN